MTKNVMPSALIVFMIMAITLVTIVAPVSAQPQPELLKAWPKYRRLTLGEYQTLYAKVKNTGTEGVDAYVEFLITCGGEVFVVRSNTMSLSPHPPPIWLEATFPCPQPGQYRIMATLYYRVGVDWVVDGIIRTIKVSFTVK